MTDAAQEDQVYRFAALDNEDAESGAINLANDERLALLAVAIAHQQGAGFKQYLDLRQVHCPTCEAPGFNTGWGYWLVTCGAEILSDGEPSEPCGSDNRAAADPASDGGGQKVED